MGEPKEMESRESKVMGKLGKEFAQARTLRSIEGEVEVGCGGCGNQIRFVASIVNTEHRCWIRRRYLEGRVGEIGQRQLQ